MQIPASYVNERLNHLGLVAGECEEIGLAAYLETATCESFYIFTFPLCASSGEHVRIGNNLLRWAYGTV